MVDDNKIDWGTMYDGTSVKARRQRERVRVDSPPRSTRTNISHTYDDPRRFDERIDPAPLETPTSLTRQIVKVLVRDPHTRLDQMMKLIDTRASRVLVARIRSDTRLTLRILHDMNRLRDVPFG